jgi:hypothetical protein
LVVGTLPSGNALRAGGGVGHEYDDSATCEQTIASVPDTLASGLRTTAMR